MTYLNLTPHAIHLNDGREFPPSGTVARVQAAFGDIVDDVCAQTFGEVSDLPAPSQGLRIIVSGLVKQAVVERGDVVAPATGHPLTVRNERGHIVSVPGFIA